ncbi:MAG: 3-deoxy-D-manno-octulosonic acid transferase [Elusimicrobiota bacterium]
MSFLILSLENIIFFPVLALIILKFAFSKRRTALLNLPAELSERMGRLRPQDLSKISGRPVYWIHAASAGEVTAAMELLRRLKDLPSAPALVVTTSTAAGKGKAASLGVEIAAFAPLDCYMAVSRFLKDVKPSALLLVETELWPHFIEICHLKKITLAIVNGRISDKNFSRMRFFSIFTKPFLRHFSLIAAQTAESAKRFAALGADPRIVRVTGNMKHDLPLPSKGDEKLDAVDMKLRDIGWQNSLIFVAGSTHPGEEEMIIEAYLRVKRSFPKLCLVIAPRHIERAFETAQNLSKLGASCALWSKTASNKPDVLLIDAIGFLPAIYRRAFLSFVGGTLVPIGGHNVMEPALAGCPIVFGPHTSSTRESAEFLVQFGGAVRVIDAESLAQILKNLAAEPSAALEMGQKSLKAARSLQGATELTMSALKNILDKHADISAPLKFRRPSQ